jgi:large subunit ribosomal protein L22
MGARKRIAAEERKEANKKLYFAKLNDCPTSPRKMRLVADMIRGVDVEKALFLLKTSPKEASTRVHKLVLSAIANWQQKNEGARIEDSELYVKSISVDSGRMLKRLQTAPQGRAHRIRKRSNHVTVFLGSRREDEAMMVMEDEVAEMSEN